MRNTPILLLFLIKKLSTSINLRQKAFYHYCLFKNQKIPKYSVYKTSLATGLFEYNLASLTKANVTIQYCACISLEKTPEKNSPISKQNCIIKGCQTVLAGRSSQKKNHIFLRNIFFISPKVHHSQSQPCSLQVNFITKFFITQGDEMFSSFVEYKKTANLMRQQFFNYLNSFQSIFVKSMISSFFKPRTSSLNSIFSNFSEFTSVKPAPFGSSLNTLAITASSMEYPVFSDIYLEFPSFLKS